MSTRQIIVDPADDAQLACGGPGLILWSSFMLSALSIGICPGIAVFFTGRGKNHGVGRLRQHKVVVWAIESLLCKAIDTVTHFAALLWPKSLPTPSPQLASPGFEEDFDALVDEQFFVDRTQESVRLNQQLDPDVSAAVFLVVVEGHEKFLSAKTLATCSGDRYALWRRLGMMVRNIVDDAPNASMGEIREREERPEAFAGSPVPIMALFSKLSCNLLVKNASLESGSIPARSNARSNGDLSRLPTP
ncbi:hypothetical protein GE21DRAFT_5960 [Neurospora crassa]|uniref:Uncharacterized protein n=1 Tax=Neurospora crassa (strain ATCC 24698 / 74-OR23-1A / CBS 708.71 / DSM 1257 / FGSC 987) TaxID=367110 RepID=Q7SAD1_NEUCR|nr:hypothetical protein NCU06299 [Neurospora crassa OR74A]EAA33325.3 hypothetical protein NCU06299 [Neurospora crassa OR74A]KHE83184.1 hypothetical protein GE21DRAFT_5960 [Neurospora crassa]|eukprot:XP_962561.3 hypothetical protein NCU06299 [Neurospora crassa OR74A]